MPALSLLNLHKSFGDTRALNGVSFDMVRGEIVALLGPSGCGKSTLLTLIAGLEVPDAGQILWEGQPLAGVPTHQRGFGLMFQDYMLFPHMNVGQNVAFGLKFAPSPNPLPWGEGLKLPSPRGRGQSSALELRGEGNRVRELLELVGLPGFERRDVSTLSGGEQQRVALARSLAPNPRLLMLDEPLGALDRALRERLLGELREILRRVEQTALYVTHDQEEAYAIADRIVIMNAGQVEQIGTPQEIYRSPASPFAARFLGFGNLIEGTVNREGTEMMTEVGSFSVSGEVLKRGDKGTVLVRPDGVRVAAEGEVFRWQGEVWEVSFRGNVQRVGVKINGVVLRFDFGGEVVLPAVGETIRLALLPGAVQVFP